LWKSRKGRVCFKVLQEFSVKARQQRSSAREEARSITYELLAWRPVSVNAEILQHSWKIQERYQLSFWDALIVGAAKAASCRYLLTEDLQSRQDFGGLLVVNPFLKDPAAIAWSLE
jgi:predicted nucleic acid-binding protein